MNKLKEAIGKILEVQVSAIRFSVVFLGVIAIRIFIEQFLAKSAPLGFYQIVIEYIHNLYFFLLAFLLLWLFFAWFLKENPKKLAMIFSLASILIIIPPILDMIKTGGEVYWSFYIISGWHDFGGQFFTFFGNLPPGIVYFGTKIVFISAIVILSAFVYLKTKNILKTILSAAVSYVILFFMGNFPSIFGYFYYTLGKNAGLSSIQSFQIAQLFGAPMKVWGLEPPSFSYSFPYKLDIVYFPFLILLLAILFYFTNPSKFWAVIKNFRYPQLIYHAGLFFVGMGLGYVNYPENFNLTVFSVFAVFTLIISIWLAWKASVVVNDIEDLEIDRISNPKRPLPSSIFSLDDYSQLGIICFLLSLLGAISVGTKFFILILVYQIFAWFYSSSPLRLKKFPIVATIMSALASLAILFMGYILMSPGQSIHGLSWRISLLLFIAYTLSLPIKDFKDIEGDGKYEIWTIPVIFGEKKSRIFVAVNVFISFVLSVFFLNELKLFFWALFFGIVSFFIINNQKIEPRRLPWCMVIPVALYLLVLIKIVFIDNLDKFLR